MIPGVKNQQISHDKIDLDKLNEFLNIEDEEGLGSNGSQVYNLEGGSSSSAVQRVADSGLFR